MRVINAEELDLVSGSGVTLTKDGGFTAEYDTIEEHYEGGNDYYHMTDGGAIWDVTVYENGSIDVFLNGDLVDSYLA
jgi:hypothetical protein